CQARCKDCVCRAVPLERAVRHLECGDAVRCNFLSCLSKCQRLRLSKEVRHQQVVMYPKWVQGLAEPDEVARNQLGALMNELVERVLAIGSRLPPDNRPGLIVHRPAV